MATSGSTNFNPEQADLAREVLERVFAVDPNTPLETELIATVRNSMNYVLKAWQNNHTFLHTRTWTQKTFTASSEVTGTDGNIYTCILGHTSSLTNKPITGANYSTYWTQKGDTGGVWAADTAYTATGDFSEDAATLDIEQAFVRDGGKDYAVDIVLIDYYLMILDKTHTGRPYLLAFDKQLTPHVYLHYQPDLTSYVLHYIKVRRLEDFDTVSNTSDMPAEHLDALLAETAYRVAAKLGRPLDERLLLKQDAREAMRNMRRGDTRGPIFLQGAF